MSFSLENGLHRQGLQGSGKGGGGVRKDQNRRRSGTFRPVVASPPSDDEELLPAGQKIRAGPQPDGGHDSHKGDSTFHRSLQSSGPPSIVPRTLPWRPR